MRKVTYPQEIEVWYVLPAIRKQIALSLIKKGMTQKEVATIMGVTEASISHYKKDKRARTNILETPKLKEQISEAVKRIMEDKSVLTAEILQLNRMVKDSGILCRLYAKNSSLEVKQRPCQRCTHHSEEEKKKRVC